MSEWKEYKLKDIATIQTGPFGSQLHMSDYKQTGTPIITVEHLGDNKILHNNLPLVGDEDKNRLIKYTLIEGDIVFSRVGSVDRRAFVSKNEDGWMYSGRCLRVRANNELVNPRFLSFCLGQESFKETIRMVAVGATMPSINTTILSEVEVELPPLPEQTAIAEVLSSLDDKIDLLHRQNKTLEQIAETLFRQWFVHRPELAEGEDKQKIKLERLGNVIKTISGGTPSRKIIDYYLNGTIHWVKSKELTGSYIFETEELITQEALKRSSAKILPSNSILIAMYGATVGEFGILANEATCNQAICALIPNENYPFTYLFLLTKINKENLLNLAIGSAQQNISQLLIKEIEVSANTDLIKQLHNGVEPLFLKIKSNTIQIKTLTKLRDTLLPKLMSGELRVQM